MCIWNRISEWEDTVMSIVSKIEKWTRTYISVLILYLLVSAATAYALSKSDVRRISTEGPVEISVVYVNPLESLGDEELQFEVRMDTHTVDLDSYRMEEISVLKLDNGKEIKPLGWFNPGGGGHHISGTLKFKGPLPENTKVMRLVISGVGSVPERVFDWTLPLQ